MTNTYELTYIIPDKFSETEIQPIAEKIKKLLGTNIIKESTLGRRKLAYPILKNNFGYYFTLVFESEPENLHKIDSKLKTEEDIIRNLIITTKVAEAKAPAKVKEAKEVKEEKEVKKVAVTEKFKTKITTKKAEKAKKPKISEELETEAKQMKALEEKLEEILKE